MTREDGPPGVAEGPKQGGEAQKRWRWVEPSVWTERMLAALETGVNGGKWYSLIDKVSRTQTLKAAFEEVKRRKGGGGVDGEEIPDFERDAERRIQRLTEELRTGRYQPKAVKRVWIEKPASKQKRPLGIPTITDRVVQGALKKVIEPIFERKFRDGSYGFRPGRGCKDALRQVQRQLDEGKTVVVDVDIERYFDTIRREGLMDEVRKEIADTKVLELLERYLRQGVMEGLESWEPESGTPQGAVISPLLANIYLHPVDEAMAEAGWEIVRYADDMVVLCRDEAEAEKALKRLTGLLEERGLKLHPEKTRIVDAQQPGGFDFLGYHFEQGRRWPRTKSMDKLKDAIRAKTKRNNGESLERIIETVSRTLRGWFEYFKHSEKDAFLRLDAWIRMRLRSVLRKRHHGRGRGRGYDHIRWPNAYFRERGLFILTEARQLLCRSR